MIRTAVVGLGKMGLSHAAIVGGIDQMDLVAVCDTSSLVLKAFEKYNKQIRVFKDYKRLMDENEIDAVIIATPTKLHFNMVKLALENNIAVFCEKPFSLTLEEGNELVELAEMRSINNQVGFHNHFIGTFREMKRLLSSGIIGELKHFSGEAYGPVITKPKVGNWRAKSEEGGGCLNDYASHVINLIQEIIGRPLEMRGTILKKIYSKDVEDAVYSNMILSNGLSGLLSVNWSDETYRKMSTSISVLGTEGKIICDATELKVYLKKENSTENLKKGWNIKYLTELSPDVSFYLRGEEYSAQLEYFASNISNNRIGEINTFEQALYTDKCIDLLRKSNNKN